MSLKSVFSQLKQIKEHVSLSRVEKEFIRFNRQYALRSPSGKKVSILIQMPQDPAFLVLYSSIIRSLKKHYLLEINWINMAFAYRLSGKSALLKMNQFYERKWNALYTSLGGKVVFTHLYSKLTLDKKASKDARQCLKDLKSKEALLKVSYEDIAIGDLIYDTYLRFKPAETVDLNDPYLNQIFVHTFTTVKKAIELLKLKKYDYLITSYCSYVPHGVMVRVALKLGVKVISSGGHNQLHKAIDASYPSHLKNYFEYAEKFQRLSTEERGLAKSSAKTYFEKRFTGHVDLSTHYMRTSAYSPTPSTTRFQFKETGKKKIVIFLHCFFDSPHTYRHMIYPDFYEWLMDTIQILQSEKNREKYDFYLKPHPNGIAGNEEIIEKFSARFPGLQFIPKTTSNRDLIEMGFDLAVTIFGTLGHEFPYFGIPVLTAGDNPHINYDFCTHAKNKEDYRRYLNDIDLIKKPGAQDKEKILEFYYMHGLHRVPGNPSPEQGMALRSYLNKFKNSDDLFEYINQCRTASADLIEIDDIVFNAMKEVL